MQAYYPSIAAHSIHHLSLSYAPYAEDLIAALQNPESLSDEALEKATLAASKALTYWQDDYLIHAEKIRSSTRSGKKANPRKLEDVQSYEKKADKRAIAAMKTYQTHTARTTQPGEKPAKRPKAVYKSNLEIDMNVPDAAKVTGKRVRKPTKKLDVKPESQPIAAAAEPSAAPKLRHQPSKPAQIAPPFAPIANKKRPQAPSPSPEAAVLEQAERPKRARKARKIFSPEPTIVPTAAKTIEREPSLAPSVGVDSKRSDAMKAVWAKRKAEGRSGRYGGAPKKEK